MIEQKACYHCGEVFPITSFMLIHKKYRARRCNACHWKRYGEKNKDLCKSDAGRKRLSHWRRTKVISDACRERERRHARKSRERYPEKQRAQRLVNDAITKGLLHRPTVCPSCHQAPGLNRRGTPLIQAHHHDYSKPLDVQWLCVNCHAAVHRQEQSALKSAPGEKKRARHLC